MPAKKKETDKKKPAKKASDKKVSSKKKLTSQQEQFVQLVCSGWGQSDAYRRAYNTSKMKDSTIHNNAYKLINNNDITTRLKALKKKAAKDAGVEMAWVVGRLATEATTGDLSKPDSARVSALKRLGDYTGGFDKNSQKVDHSSSDGSMTPVREGMNAFYEDLEKEDK